MEKFEIIESQCIGCGACERVAPDNFKIDNKKAVIYKAPINREEEKKCENALEACPTNAIKIIDSDIITGSSKVKSTIDKYPELMEVLLSLSPKFKNMKNPIMWNTVAKYASFLDASKMTGVSICTILHELNKKIGKEKLLFKLFPDCIKKDDNYITKGESITWEETDEPIDISGNESIMTKDVIKDLNELEPKRSKIIITNFFPEPIIKFVEEMGYKYNVMQIHPNKYRVSIFNDSKNKQDNTIYEKLDVREMKRDPFDLIIKKAYEIAPGQGFILIQTFEPIPIINMLTEMGFEHRVEKKSFNETYVYFTKKIDRNIQGFYSSDKPEIVIQSATPVAYPIIMKLLESEKIKNTIRIKELKVWKETEKHLSWIVNGRADISFSAVITASKLRNSDVKMPAVLVWDNFSLITRGYIAKSFADIIHHKIYTPLFADAPPAKITKYLIQSEGLNPNNFQFVYGKPFGRPAKMAIEFIKGNIDTVILREPEISFVINAMDKKYDYSIISFGELWNKLNPDFGLFPNAGVIFKGEFIRKYPKIVRLFLKEIEESVKWINTNKKQAAKLSFDIMRSSLSDTELFLYRVKYKYTEGKELMNKIYNFYKILIDNNILLTELDKSLMDIFRLE